jgi:hypothetical protein
LRPLIPLYLAKTKTKSKKRFIFPKINKEATSPPKVFAEGDANHLWCSPPTTSGGTRGGWRWLAPLVFAEGCHLWWTGGA